MTTKSITLLNLQDLANYLNISASTIYRMIDAKSAYHDPQFPQPIHLSSRSVRWRFEQIEQWLEKKRHCKTE